MQICNIGAKNLNGSSFSLIIYSRYLSFFSTNAILSHKLILKNLILLFLCECPPYEVLIVILYRKTFCRDYTDKACN